MTITETKLWTVSLLTAVVWGAGYYMAVHAFLSYVTR